MATVECQQCGKDHEAEFSHVAQFGTKPNIYAVVCTEDGLTDYYTEDMVTK